MPGGVLGRRLERIYELAGTPDRDLRFIVFGSFAASRVEPKDPALRWVPGYYRDYWAAALIASPSARGQCTAERFRT